MKNKIRVTRQGVYVNGKKIERTPTKEVRHVFFCDNIVIKVDQEPDDDSDYDPSACQCYNEVEFWNEIVKECDRKYFQPFVAHGKNWLAQEKITFHQPTIDDWNIVLMIADKYDLVDIGWDYNTKTPHNWTVNDEGQPIIYDYGL